MNSGQSGFSTEVVRPSLRPSITPMDRRAARTAAPSPWEGLVPHLATEASPVLAPGVPILSAIAADGTRRKSEIVLTLSWPTRLAAFALADPPRLIVDGAGLAFAPNAEVMLSARGLVSHVRFGALNDTHGRLVFEVRDGVEVLGIASSRQAGGGVRVAITVQPSTRGASRPPVISDVVPAEDASPFSGNDRQKVVVIDPGHGGIDPGAVAAPTVLEKDVVLAVALQLRARLLASGRVRVVMTRMADVAVGLDRRVSVADAAGADLFVSLHADAVEADAQVVRGGSVYVLADRGSNAAAVALAEKENAADQRAGVAGGVERRDGEVGGILADLTVRETQGLAHLFQGALVKHLRRSMLLAREPARAADFRVLRQAKTPAVLIELGYMSNAQDIGLLNSPAWQADVAARIAEAIETYFAAPRRSVIGSPRAH